MVDVLLAVDDRLRRKIERGGDAGREQEAGRDGRRRCRCGRRRWRRRRAGGCRCGGHAAGRLGLQRGLDIGQELVEIQPGEGQGRIDQHRGAQLHRDLAIGLVVAERKRDVGQLDRVGRGVDAGGQHEGLGQRGRQAPGARDLQQHARLGDLGIELAFEGRRRLIGGAVEFQDGRIAGHVDQKLEVRRTYAEPADGDIEMRQDARKLGVALGREGPGEGAGRHGRVQGLDLLLGGAAAIDDGAVDDAEIIDGDRRQAPARPRRSGRRLCRHRAARRCLRRWARRSSSRAHRQAAPARPRDRPA